MSTKHVEASKESIEELLSLGDLEQKDLAEGKLCNKEKIVIAELCDLIESQQRVDVAIKNLKKRRMVYISILKAKDVGGYDLTKYLTRRLEGMIR